MKKNPRSTDPEREETASAAAPDAASDTDSDVVSEETATVRGRALIDLPAHKVRCGEFTDLPEAVAAALSAAGEFDLAAVES